MAKQKKWLCIMSGLIVAISTLLALYVFFIKDWPTRFPFYSLTFSSNFSRSECSSRVISNVALSVIPKSKTGVMLVFDLNEILLDIDSRKIIQQIGFSQAMSYSRSKNIGLSDIGTELSRVVYVILHKISGDLVHNYDQIPDCVKDWQTGKKSGSELKKIVLQKIEKHAEWFANSLEKEIVSMLILNMLTPEAFVSTLKVVHSGLEALMRYKNKNHTIIAFFNSDSETLALLKEKFPELFSLFDGVIASCDIHQIKPNLEAYTFFLDRKREYGESILLIEAEKSQHKAALSYGLESVLIPKKSGFLGLNSYPDFTVLDKKLSK